MDKNVNFTGEELQEIAIMIRRSLGILSERIRKVQKFRSNINSLIESQEALKAFSDQEQLLKSLLFKINVCRSNHETKQKAKEIFAEMVQGLTTEEIYNKLMSDKKWEDKYADYLIDNAKSIDIEAELKK